jgi:hypothetical protein
VNQRAGFSETKFVRVAAGSPLNVPPTIWTTWPSRKSMHGRNIAVNVTAACDRRNSFACTMERF